MAGALSRRDIEMIFRAETDKATRPIADLGKAVKASRSQLQEMIEAAERGEVSLDKLGATTRDLKKAQDELGTARALLTQLNAQESALEKAEQKADAAAKKYAELKEQVAGADQPTKRLVNSMEAAGRASAAAAERLENVRSEAAATRQQIEQIIGPVENVGNSFRDIANTAQDIARGLAVAGAASDDFKQKIAGAAASAADLDRFNALAGKSSLLQEQIAYISQFEDRIQRLRDAEQAQASAQREAASADVLAKTRQRAALDDVLQGNKALEAEIAQVAAEAERLEAVQGYQRIAQEARAAVNDVTRFGVSEDAAAASSERLANALRNIISPSAAASASIDSIEASLVGVDSTLRNTRSSAADYGVAVNDLQGAAAGINRIAGQIDGFRDQERAVAAATARFEEARTKALALASALDQPGEDAQKLARDLRSAEAEVERAGNEMQKQGQRAREMANELRRAGVDVDDLAAAERRLTEAARQTGKATQDISKRNSGAGNFLGLSPQDATNLSYQINDIFTQLASGQSLFITLAQQGPQIWQIGGIQAYLASVKALLIPLASVAAGLGLVAGGVYAINAATTDEKLEAFQARLGAMADKGDISAAALARASEKLEDVGLKANDAADVLIGLNNDGFNPSYLDAFVAGVKNMAQVTGTDAKQAAEDLTTALNGNYDSIVELNDKYGVLSDAELENIRIMFESGKADEARQVIFDAFTSKYQAAADKMNGPWSNAWDNLKAAAERFGKFIAGPLDGWLKGMRQNLDEAAIGVNYLLLRMRGLSAEQAGNIAVNGQGRVPTARGSGRVVGTPDTTAAGRQAADEAEREAKAKGKTLTAAERLAAVEKKARLDAQGRGFGRNDVNRLAAAARAKEQATIDQENERAAKKAGRAAESARKKAAREAETLANKIASQQEQLESALDTMGAKVAKVAAGSLQEQLGNAATAVNKEYDKLYRRLEDFSKLTGGKGTIGGRTIEQYRATLDANKQVLTQQAQLKVYEENVNDLLSQRKQLLADIEDQAARGAISPAEAIKQTEEVISRFDPLIANVTKAAVTFARSIGGATPSAELQAFIAKMERTATANAGTDQADVRKSANANVGRAESELNKILSERNSLVEQYNTLAELGLITQDEARKRSAAAYNASKGLIDQQITALRAAVTEAARLGAISPQAFAAFEAKMQAVGAQAEYLDPRFAQLKQSIDGVVSQNIVNGIDRIAAAIGAASVGAMSWGDALREAGYAILDLFAQTLGQVAKLILQMLVLDAVQKVTGIPVAALLGTQAPGQKGGGFSLFGLKLFHGGGTVGEYGAGQQRRSGLSISPAAIAMAPRYHEGTPSVGLGANEQLAVLERGEKVLTEKQQRDEAAAKAAAGGGGRGLRQVLAFGDDQVAAAMAGPAGEDVTVTHLRRNVPLLKQLVNEG